VTTTRRGWRVALDSLLLRTVVACGSLSVLLSATPAAAGLAGREMTVASAGSGAAFVAPGLGNVVDEGSPETCIVEAGTLAPQESGGKFTGTCESIPRDSADDDDDDDDGFDDLLSHGSVHALGTRELPRLELNPSISLESDGHSLRAPPQ
jgi:hypothetical protein